VVAGPRNHLYRTTLCISKRRFFVFGATLRIKRNLDHAGQFAFKFDLGGPGLALVDSDALDQASDDLCRLGPCVLLLEEVSKLGNTACPKAVCTNAAAGLFLL